MAFVPLNSNLNSIYNLGTGTSFDIKTLLPNVDYTQLNADNFIPSITGMPSASAPVVIYSAGGNWGGATAGGFNVTKNYDANTGIFKISGISQTITRTCNNTELQTTATQTATINVYLIIGDVKTL